MATKNPWVVNGTLLPAGSNIIPSRMMPWPTTSGALVGGHAMPVMGPLPRWMREWGLSERFAPLPQHYRDDNGLVHRIFKEKPSKYRRESLCGLQFRLGLLTKTDAGLNCFGCMEEMRERR